MTTIRVVEPADLPWIEALLANAALPIADLRSAPIDFLVAERDGALVGTVGLERHASAALLRSLAVQPGERGRGTGTALVDAVEAMALSGGVRQLALLTETAAHFFAHRGYLQIDRCAAPQALQASAEFRSLCPASAICMVKVLENES